MRCSGQAPGSETNEARERDAQRASEGGREASEGIAVERSVGGRCQKGVITWRQTDSIFRPELEPAVQYHTHGAVTGLG